MSITHHQTFFHAQIFASNRIETEHIPFFQQPALVYDTNMGEWQLIHRGRSRTSDADINARSPAHRRGVSTGAPCENWQAILLGLPAGRCRRTKIEASRLGGNAPTSFTSATIPPAEAPTTMISRLGMISSR